MKRIMGLTAFFLALFANSAHAQLLHQSSAVLSHAQIIALPSMPVEIAPTPPSGRVLILVQSVLWWDVTTPYTNISGEQNTYIGIRCDADQLRGVRGVSGLNGDYNGLAIVLGGAPELKLEYTGAIIPTDAYAAPDVPLTLFAYNVDGDFTGGSSANSLRVHVAYLILNTITGQFE